MTTNALDATIRTSGGKGPARRLRAEGKMPAVAYGDGLAATPLALSPKELGRILAGEHGLNTVIQLTLDGQVKMSTLVVDYQIHPITRAFLHADFKKIDLDKPVDVEVKLELTGKAAGVTAGGEQHQVFRKLPVRCLPGLIPVKITHDMTEVTLDSGVHVKELKLPDGVQVLLPPERTVAAVVAKRKQKEDEETAKEGAAAVPAGGSQAPAAKDKDEAKAEK
jgi:large subunit ribosomal protein L25